MNQHSMILEGYIIFGYYAFSNTPILFKIKSVIRINTLEMNKHTNDNIKDIIFV